MTQAQGSIGTRIYRQTKLDATIAPTISERLPRDNGAQAYALPRASLLDVDGDMPVYSLRGRLGAGGMGEVWSARQRSLERDVAIKIAHRASDDGAAHALLHEARILGRLEHPHIVPAYDALRDERGSPVLVMRRIEGVSWSQLLREPSHALWSTLEVGTQDRLEANLRILMTVCDAAHFAHGAGIIHRDIKPPNVMVGEYGETYLVDWGIATFAKEGTPPPIEQLVGTLSYMAPEMVDATMGSIERRTDVYLLGSTLHYLLTGSSRHKAESELATLGSIIMSSPMNYDDTVPPELGAIANRATARDPAERYPTAEAVRRAIAEFLTHRAARSLERRANTLLAELRALVDGSSQEDTVRDRIHALGIECRFAYRTALEQWPDFPEAHDGLAQCLRTLLRHELVRDNVVGARALYAELGTKDASLEDLLEQAKERERRREEDRQRDIQARHDNDLDVAAGGRKYLGLFVAAVIAGIAILFAITRTLVGREPRKEFALLVAPAVTLVVFFIFYRLKQDEVGRNLLARKVVLFLPGLLAWIIAARIASNLIGGLPHSATVVAELLTILVTGVYASAALGYALWVTLGTVSATILAALAFPSLRERPSLLIGICFVSVAVEALRWSRSGRNGDGADS